MSLFETCIHRPVFAIVMTLLLVLFGLLSFEIARSRVSRH